MLGWGGGFYIVNLLFFNVSRGVFLGVDMEGVDFFKLCCFVVFGGLEGKVFYF